jgi:arylsulfatase A-like enzyme
LQLAPRNALASNLSPTYYRCDCSSSREPVPNLGSNEQHPDVLGQNLGGRPPIDKTSQRDSLTEASQCRPSILVARFSVLAALAGLVIGVVEAAYLYRTPRIPGLLEPDVSYVIWFLDPLALLTVFGILGLICGLAAIARRRSGWSWVAVCASLGASMAGLYAVALGVRWFGGRFDLDLISPAPLIIWGLLFCAIWLGCHCWPQPARHVLEKNVPPLKHLAVILLLGASVAASGVLYYKSGHAIHRRIPGIDRPAAPGSPNIVLITLDTVRADHLSVYGYPRPTTPNLGKWARRGLVFENAIAPSSWTLPNHASIFTGLLPHQHGADWIHAMDTRRWTLAEVLRSWGYETAGFSSNFVFGQGGWGMNQGFEEYDDDSVTVRHNLMALAVGQMLLQPLYYACIRPEEFDRRDARELNEEIFRWLRHRSSRPFFLFINYFDAHDPYLVPSGFPSRFAPLPARLVRKARPAIRNDERGEISSGETASLIDGYDDCLAFLDESVGHLLATLSSLPEWPNTLVIITADHGEAFGEHGAYGHSTNLYREVLRVPLIVLGPNIPAGQRISYLVRTRELFPTVLDFATHGSPAFRRTSLRRFWTPGFQPEDSESPIVSELIPKIAVSTLPPSISLMTSEWHYLRDPQGGDEIYHWVSDPKETINLANSAEHQQVLRDLQTRLRRLVASSLRPWRRPEYLFALDEPDSNFISQSIRSTDYAGGSPHPPPPIGTLQALFPPQDSAGSQEPAKPDEELLRSLPYR